MKKAFITGITGQDGSYLAEFLLEKGYEVHGMIRRSSSFNTGRIDHIFNKLKLYYGDLTDGNSVNKLLKDIKPDEIYNLAAQSHVGVSFETPYYTTMVDGVGTLTILEAMKNHVPKSKFYQASTSELYGKVMEIPQNEETPFNPCSPYGVAKLYGYWIVKNYRDAYNLFACNGVLFNHESPRRGRTFVTRKVITELIRVKHGEIDHLKIGNLEAQRDWGYAPEFVEGMWLVLQQDKPNDYVLATGETHTVRELVEEVCKNLDIDLEWTGDGIGEQGIDLNTNEVVIRIDRKYFRPIEVDMLIGDPEKAKLELGWAPKIKFEELIKLMVEADMDKFLNGKL